MKTVLRHCVAGIIMLSATAWAQQPLVPVHLKIQPFEWQGALCWFQLRWDFHPGNGFQYVVEARDRFSDWHEINGYPWIYGSVGHFYWMAYGYIPEDPAAWPVEYRVRRKYGPLRASESVFFGTPPLTDFSLANIEVFDELPVIKLPTNNLPGSPVRYLFEKCNLSDTNLYFWAYAGEQAAGRPDWTDLHYDTQNTPAMVYRFREIGTNFVSAPSTVYFVNIYRCRTIPEAEQVASSVKLQWPPEGYVQDYFVERLSSNGLWETLSCESAGPQGFPNPVTFFDPLEDAGVYTYRLRERFEDTNHYFMVSAPSAPVTVHFAPRDSDGDGLSDADELNVHHTDPYAPDTDRDGMPDGWEVEHQLNPLQDDAAGDADDDGSTNLEEYQNGTDPQGPASPQPVVNLALSARGTRLHAILAPRAIDGLTSRYTAFTGFACCDVGQSMMMDLRERCRIGQVRLLLWDKDNRTYGYSMDASADGLLWTNVVASRTGRSWQLLSFAAPVWARYLRLNALSNTANAGFHVVEWEVYGRVMPEPSSFTNLALASRGAVLYAHRAAFAIDGVDQGYTYLSGYAHCAVGGCMMMDLQSVCTIDHLNLLLFDLDARWYGYRIEVSQDACHWFEVVPTRASYGWQFLKLASPVQARYLRLLALGNSAGRGFHVVEWEVYGRERTLLSSLVGVQLRRL